MSADDPARGDIDNPEWTSEDFAKAKPSSDLPADLLSRFANARRPRGPQKAPKKVQVAIRSSPDIVEHHRASGPGWHGRMEAALKKAAGL